MRRSKIEEPLYVVMNDRDEVFVGMLGGSFVFSSFQEDPKRLYLSNK